MRTLLLVGLSLLFLLPSLVSATVICTANDDGGGKITVTATSDNNFISFETFVGSNANLGMQNCANPDGTATGNNPCVWEAIQIAPGPATAEVDGIDESGRFFCGPFDNDDGLPVELIEFSVN